MCSKNNTGSSLRTADASRPITSAGLDGATGDLDSPAWDRSGATVGPDGATGDLDATAPSLNGGTGDLDGAAPGLDGTAGDRSAGAEGRSGGAATLGQDDPDGLRADATSPTG